MKSGLTMQVVHVPLSDVQVCSLTFFSDFDAAAAAEFYGTSVQSLR